MSKQNNKKNTISFNTVNRLNSIFCSKEWPRNIEFGYNCFEHFCDTLSLFNEEQQNLILELTERFLWIKESEYLSLFQKSFELYVANIPTNQKTKLLICPLLCEEDFDKNKSSTYLYYILKCCLKPFQSIYKTTCSICMIDSPKFVERIRDYINNYGFTLCLIDDYIGSGETLRSGISFLEDNNISRDSIVTISIVAMKDTINQMRNESYRIYSDCLLDKGLSPLNNSKYNCLMEEIEDILRVDEDNRFGYKQTEALVRMRRTPNNTFPVYWLDKSKSITAPFPR